jgi:hypothetical protein
MNPESDNHFHTEWIERYLLGELKGEELTEFNHLLRTDPTFHHEVVLQRSIIEQAQQVAREDMRQQLKDLHRQLGFAKEKVRPLPFTFYAIAAAVVLLLVSTAVFYFSYFNQSVPGDTRTASANKKPALLSQPAVIRLRVMGENPKMGISGVHRDSTVAILLYPATSTSPAYQFDDTLRLYGTFTPDHLTLQYDQAKEQYTLLIDSLSFPLQRYRPSQTLRATE